MVRGIIDGGKPLVTGFIGNPWSRKRQLADRFRAEHVLDFEKKWQTKLLNQLRVISTSRTTLPTTWQSAVFPYSKQTVTESHKKKTRTKFIFHLATLTLTDPMNASRSIYLFVCSNHHFSTDTDSSSTPYIKSRNPQCFYAICRRVYARNVMFVISSQWKFDPYQLVWYQILVFHFPFEATKQFP